MKELTIEQKAKAYDEAIERAKNFIENGDERERTIAESIFAGLMKESEDEKVEKAIFGMVYDSDNDLWSSYDVSKSDVLAWLEKQGNTNETIDRDEFAQGVLRGAAINLITWIDYNAAEGSMCLSNTECKDITDALVNGDWDKIYAYIKKKLEKQSNKPQGKTALEAIKEEKVDNQNCVKPADKVELKFKVGDTVTVKPMSCHGKVFKGEPFKIVDIIEDNYVSDDGKTYGISLQDGWELVEQKPTDKVESRFKVGDWITNGKCTWKIDSIDEDMYYNNHCGIDCGGDIKSIDEEYHLWTIQDAKDGDVLVTGNKNIFIFKYRVFNIISKILFYKFPTVL